MHKISIFKSKNDLNINFDKSPYITVITGIPGGGKSYLANLLSKKFDQPIISFDFLFDYENRKMNKIEKQIISNFLKKYPNYSNFENNRNNEEIICNLFFDYIIKYINKNKIHVIVDSAYFFKYIDINKIIDYKIIIKRTSLLRSFYNENKRDVLRQWKNKDLSFIKKIVRSFKIPLISLLNIKLLINNYKNINIYINKLCNTINI